MSKRLSNQEEIFIVTQGEIASHQDLGQSDNPYTRDDRRHDLWEWGRQHGIRKFCRAKERAVG